MERYLDDIFSLWNTAKKKIGSFIELANNHHPTIKSTAEISETEITLLDACVHKGYRFERESILDVRTHFKPTESFQYTKFSSCHPLGVWKGFTKGEALRLLRTNSSEEAFEERGVIQITFWITFFVCAPSLALRRSDVSSPLVVVFVAGSIRPLIISLTSSNKEIHQADSPPSEVLYSRAAISNKEFLFFTWQNRRIYFA